MEYKLPPKFERDTRWLYVRAGVEYGPFGASDMLKAMDEHTIDGQTVICELMTGRRCSLAEVKPFAEYIPVVAKRDEYQAAEREFEESTKRMASHNRPLIVGLALGVPLVVGGLLAFILWPKPVEDEGPDPAAAAPAVVVTDPALVKASAPVEKEVTEEEPEVITLSGDGEQDDAAASVAGLVGKNGLVAAQQIDVNVSPEMAARIAAEAELRKQRKAREQGAGGAQAGAEGDESSVIDFGGEEYSAKDESRSLARQHLKDTVRACARSAMKATGTQETISVSASIRAEPDGRMRGLQLSVEPQGPVSQIKVCVLGELPAIRLPAYSGEAQSVSVTLSVAPN